MSGASILIVAIFLIIAYLFKVLIYLQLALVKLRQTEPILEEWQQAIDDWDKDPVIAHIVCRRCELEVKKIRAEHDRLTNTGVSPFKWKTN